MHIRVYSGLRKTRKLLSRAEEGETKGIGEEETGAKKTRVLLLMVLATGIPKAKSIAF